MRERLDKIRWPRRHGSAPSQWTRNSVINARVARAAVAVAVSLGASVAFGDVGGESYNRGRSFPQTSVTTLVVASKSESVPSRCSSECATCSSVKRSEASVDVSPRAPPLASRVQKVGGKESGSTSPLRRQPPISRPGRCTGPTTRAMPTMG
jgi:hypothetical protein